MDYIARKLSPKYAGPFKVIKVISPVVDEIQDESGIIEKAHVKDLKHYWSVDPDLVNNEFSFQPSSDEENARLPSFDGIGYSCPEGNDPSATGAKTTSEGFSPHSMGSSRRGRSVWRPSPFYFMPAGQEAGRDAPKNTEARKDRGRPRKAIRSVLTARVGRRRCPGRPKGKGSRPQSGRPSEGAEEEQEEEGLRISSRLGGRQAGGP